MLRDYRTRNDEDLAVEDGETEAALVQVVDALPSFATSSDGEVAAVRFGTHVVIITTSYDKLRQNWRGL